MCYIRIGMNKIYINITYKSVSVRIFLKHFMLNSVTTLFSFYSQLDISNDEKDEREIILKKRWEISSQSMCLYRFRSSAYLYSSWFLLSLLYVWLSISYLLSLSLSLSIYLYLFLLLMLSFSFFLHYSYTGHMRFIGEIYMYGLIGVSKMKYCIEALITSPEVNTHFLSCSIFIILRMYFFLPCFLSLRLTVCVCPLSLLLSL